MKKKNNIKNQPVYLKKKQLYLDLRSAYVENDCLISETKEFLFGGRRGTGEEGGEVTIHFLEPSVKSLLKSVLFQKLFFM